MIKIINAGDPVLDDTLGNFYNKGITNIYIPNLEYDKYIKFNQELSSNSIKQETKASKKVQNLLTFGSSISHSLVQQGITLKKLDVANELLNQSVSLIKNLRMRDQKLSSFIELIEAKEHLSFVSFMSCLIANEIGFESSKMVKLVGVSGLMHDIGLYTLDPTIVDEKKCIEQNTEVFKKHAAYGAELMRKSGSFEEAACLTVEYHHLRRKGKSENKSTNVNLLTEIISVSDDLHNFVISEGFKEEKLNYALAYELKNYSPSIEKAVTKLFKLE